MIEERPKSRKLRALQQAYGKPIREIAADAERAVGTYAEIAATWQERVDEYFPNQGLAYTHHDVFRLLKRHQGRQAVRPSAEVAAL